MSSYVLSSTSATVNEGGSVTIILDTLGVSNGTLVPYVITGTNIDLSDITGLTSLSGNFRVIDNRASLTLNITNDLRTELGEILTLSLLGDGAGTSISIYILDTSKTNPNTVVNFKITSPSRFLQEGQTGTFNITADNLANGTVVAYRFLGINQDDLNTGSNVGYLTFLPNGVTNQTNASITFQLADDFKTEGQESIVLVLEPDFKYSIEVSSTLSVDDTSISIIPTYTIYANKQRVVEGSNVTIFVNTTNVNDGTILPWRILPFKGDITAGDFNNVYANLQGTFPPLISGSANFELQTRDDYTFEQNEIFFVNIPGTQAVTDLIEIIDSGNTLLVSDATFTGNARIKFLDPAILRANLGCVTDSIGFWKDTTGLLSENMVLQGRSVYATETDLALYQPFSYVIRSSKSIDDWQNTVKNILHPAGFAFFSEINEETQPDEVLSLEAKATEDCEIETYYTITADKQFADSTSNITIDSVTNLFNLFFNI